MSLEFEYLFFDTISYDELVAGDHLGLADTVGTVRGLSFGGGIPPGVVVDDGVGGGEVESGAAGFEGDEEYGDVVAVVEAVDFGHAIACFSVDVAEGHF